MGWDPLSWVGRSKGELDTPVLCVDLDRLERNIARLNEEVRRNGIGNRPHAKAHKCPEIARRQVEAGGLGISVATLHEARVMVDAGLHPILVTTPVVSASKITRLVDLARRSAGFTMVTDTVAKAELISSAAARAGVTIEILIDMDPGVHRTGVAPGRPALELAEAIGRLPNLELRGVQCYDGLSQHVRGFDRRRKQVLARMAPVAETVAVLRRAGFEMEVFTGGGTGTYNIDHEHEGFTDVQCGSYVFMDAQYLAIGRADGSPINDDFLPSLSVLATVIAANADGLATADAGTKALTCDEPDPIVVGAPDVRFHTRSDEFGMIHYDQANRRYRPGDRLELIVPHVDPVVNLFDRLVVTRADHVVAIWPIAARGY